MQINTKSVEQLLDSADHHFEQHGGSVITAGSAASTPHLPEGWILYSAYRVLDGTRKGWTMKLLNTAKPFRKDSVVDARHNGSLDAALLAASTKIRAASHAHAG